MNRTVSLRVRLTAIILLPLMTLAVVAGLWQLNNARQTAADVFDRSLLSAALAVANDVAISGGDALLPRTRDILSSTSGGPVFYHVYAPDGVIVAGYATPPVGIPRTEEEAVAPTYFDAIYQGQAVSGVRVQNRTEVDGFAGIFTTTVWQNRTVRTAFVRQLVLRSLITISVLIASLAFIVWFGVRLGLRPLIDLEEAIEQRTGDELKAIQRAVPQEVEGIVQTLNRLFAQVSRSMTAQSEFIANAAHQLRNPIAGVLALAEAVTTAPDADAARMRAQDLLTAARETAELSQKLLLLERAEAISPLSAQAPLVLDQCLRQWNDALQDEMPDDVILSLTVQPGLPPLMADATMLREAVVNLVRNACQHGGSSLSQIAVSAARQGNRIALSVADDGRGLDADEVGKALERFTQVAETSSSGLGLSIVQAIVHGHGGSFDLTPQAKGLRATLVLPLPRV
ncbi:MAG: sensor histidine kinase [Pseudomonadota bacterium]